ncbi:ADP-ribosylation factor-like protein 1 [Nosema granulosis]|uniref:ADP-ribosylation factor-like protein 1 n=1 Tax=Nosema granulosis TaxID=83296 RepID=A0A9P6H1K0_9MICR|nr:ADP-ribosylation factor-like protein 1 [Nosema granulosis]
MGNYISKVMYSRAKKTLILGYEASGKTTIFHIINKKYNTKPRNVDHIHSNGFNVDIIKNMVIWDLSGKKTMVPFWSCYFNNVDGVVWVYDPTSKECNEILEMMCTLMASLELFKAKMLVYVHKSDLVEEDILKKALENIYLMFPNRTIRVLPTGLNNIETIYEGFDWLYETITANKGKKLYIF